MSFKLILERRALTVLALCSLASACGVDAGESGRHPPRAAVADPAERGAVAVPTPSQRQELPPPNAQEPQLSTLAPTAPRSILDDKPSAEPIAKVDEKSSGKRDAQVSLEQVKVDRFVLATGVEQREPVGESEHFTTETPKIFAFMQFANTDAPFTVKVHWEKVSDPASPYGTELQVPTAVRHRTWSWTKIRRAPGAYRAVVRTLDGRELASKEFVIEAEAGSLRPKDVSPPH